MLTFLLVIMIQAGQPKAGVELIPPTISCEKVRQQVLDLVKDYDAKILKAECITIRNSED